MAVEKSINQTLYSEGATLARTRVESFAATLDRRKSSTSKLVRAPALASKLQNRSETLDTSKPKIKEKLQKQTNKQREGIKGL